MTQQIPGRTMRNAQDLYQVWQEIFAIERVYERTLYLSFLDAEDRVMPLVVPIDDLPVAPDQELVDGLGRITDGLSERGVRSVAVAIARPGSRHMSANDRAWARLLLQVDPVRRWPIHLATPEQLHVFAADDLMVA